MAKLDTPYHMNMGVMKVLILVEPFLVIITIYLHVVYLLYLYAQEKRRRIEK